MKKVTGVFIVALVLLVAVGFFVDMVVEATGGCIRYLML
jgi:hypothetical protein